MEFAANCPEACPPPQASPVDGLVVRFVKNAPPLSSDFRSYVDEGKKAPNPCWGCALSVFTRLEHAQAAQQAMAWFRTRRIAKATLRPEHGVLQQTGPNSFHFSLWVAREHAAALHALFEVAA